MIRADKKLFTPGPLNTKASVKEAALRDIGSRDYEFIEIVANVHQELLKIAGTSNDNGYEAVIMQGSGTYAVEGTLTTAIPEGGKVLNIINGAYGRRISTILDIHNIEHLDIIFAENELPNINIIEDAIKYNENIKYLSVIYCETTTGIINPIEEIMKIAKNYGIITIVDAMSIFGAIEINVNDMQIDYLISSSNKCIEGIPGFAFVIFNREVLVNTNRKKRTLSLDIFDQWKGLERDGQFRFTPPIQAILAFNQALVEMEAEGGVIARKAKYKRNAAIILKGMEALGFEKYLDNDKESYIINTFRYPKTIPFDFTTFYRRLNEKNLVIYPGKLTNEDCFRIGNIGELNEKDMETLLDAIESVVNEFKAI